MGVKGKVEQILMGAESLLAERGLRVKGRRGCSDLNFLGADHDHEKQYLPIMSPIRRQADQPTLIRKLYFYHTRVLQNSFVIVIFSLISVLY